MINPKINELSLPDKYRKSLKLFCQELVKTFGDNLLSIQLVGSAVSEDYLNHCSDINLLIIINELEMDNVSTIAPLTYRKWRWKRISPRFISKRNLENAVHFFPIDYWTMQQRSITLYGQEILNQIDFKKDDLVWQLNHEIKGLRMRVKQQFWRTFAHPYFAKKNLMADFNMIIHLVKVIYFIKNIPLPERMDQLIEDAANHLKLDKTILLDLFLIKKYNRKIKRKDILSMYTRFMNLIRQVDDIIEEVSR